MSDIEERLRTVRCPTACSAGVALADLCRVLAEELDAANAKLTALVHALEDDALARKIVLNENPVWTRSAGIEDYRAALREIADPKTALTGEKEAK